MMGPQAGDGHCTRRGRGDRAFSLAELMIAFAVLAMGLLVIGAALPIGVQYTQKSVNLATGEAAAQYALDTVAQAINLPHRLLNTAGDTWVRRPVIFQPRLPLTEHEPDEDWFAGDFLESWEPLVKVRPLPVLGINATPGDSTYGEPLDGDQFRVEELIGAKLLGELDQEREWDKREWMGWALPGTATVYPPVSSTDPLLPADYFGYGGQYGTLPITAAEGRKSLDRLIGWTAFYRRVSHAPGSDPGLYEVIVVVTRKPSPNHRFTVQDMTGAKLSAGPFGRDTGLDLTASDKDCGAPVPWLVTFTGYLPAPNNGFDPDGFPRHVNDEPPATLTFTCAPAADGIFPVGAVIIPARNDDNPSTLTDSEVVGFAPPAPAGLPIYTVTGRPSETQVVVAYNGYYPRKGRYPASIYTPPPGDWPVWVVPPAFSQRTGGVPDFDEATSVLAVGRRYVRIREIP